MMITKTPGEIKKNLECCKNTSNCDWCLNSYICDRERDALAYIQQLEAQVPKWISVEEKLPEDDVCVLIYTVDKKENFCITLGSYTHNMYGYNIKGWSSPWQEFFYEPKVTHWMPLPEPPKGSAIDGNY